MIYLRENLKKNKAGVKLDTVVHMTSIDSDCKKNDKKYLVCLN